MAKHFRTILLLITIALLAACSPAASESVAPMAPGGGDMAVGEGGAPSYEAPIEERAFDSDGSLNATGETIERLVIKNGSLAIAVSDVLATMDSVTALVEEMGGFVVSSYLYYYTLESGEEVPQAEVTIRVPAERFEEALTIIKAGAGEVLSENLSGQDVTQEYTDLNSRLTNLVAAEAELQRIMEEARDTEDVLAVYNQLIYIREQIEVIQGQINYYEQSATFSAISVSISTDKAVQPLSIGGWEPVGVAKDAIQALINTFKAIADALIWIILLVLPVLMFLYLIFLLLRKIYRSLFKRGPKTPKAAEDKVP